jgi:hypothetical protein
MKWAIRMSEAVAGIAFCTAALGQGVAGRLDLTCAQPVLHYKLYLSVDLGAKTAAAWFEPVSQTEAHKVPATITDSMVAWTLHARQGASSFTLDRGSGALTVLHADRETERWNCEKAAGSM